MAVPESIHRELRAVALDRLAGARVVPFELDDGSRDNEAVWVPYGEGFEIPVVFSYDGSGPFNWVAWIGVADDGRPRCFDLNCSGEVTAEALRRFPLGRVVEEAAIMASRSTAESVHRQTFWQSIDEARAAREPVVEHHKRSASKRRRLTDDHLAEIAEVYRENVATGRPSKAVAKRFHYSDTSARRVVREARLRGFLGEARPGKGGEQPKEGNDG